jgi:predicted AAA+ superfamily ATPase
MSLEGYNYRFIEKIIDMYLKAIGGILLEGPKWCGKTTTAKLKSASSFMVADDKNNFQNKTIAEMNPASVLLGDRPRLVDEWQLVPRIWDAARVEIDKDNKKGKYILTGSAIPENAGAQIFHSGAGRFARIHMRTMSLSEMNLSSGEISLSKLFAKRKKKIAFAGGTTLSEISDYILRSGFPGTLNLDNQSAMLVTKEYVRLLMSDDVKRFSSRRIDLKKFKLLLRSIARNDQTLVSNKTLYEDAKISEPTLNFYLNLLSRLFVIEPIPPWSFNVRSRKRVRNREKMRFMDPAISCASLNLDKKKLMTNTKTTGFLFESLCTKDILTYADANEFSVCHYRETGSDNPLEVDLIVEAKGEKWAGIEVKLGVNELDKAEKNLLRLKNSVIKNGGPPPSFLAMVCGVSSGAHTTKNGVYVIPINMLTA